MEAWQLEPAHDLGTSEAERLRSLRRESGLISTGAHLAWWTLVRGYLALWHRLSIQGRRNLPTEPPFVMVANHTSHLDALVLASPLPWWLRDRIFPIAAGDVFFQTTLHSVFAAAMLNALPMWRKKPGSHAMEELRRRLAEEPCGYILFPEGARSRDGQMLRFKPGLGMLVADTQVPVVPCHISGCIEALHADMRWPRPVQIRLRIGVPFTCADVPNDRGGWNRITAQTEARIRALA